MIELPDPEPKDYSRAAEVRKTYDEAISRATKFLISSAIILLILVVIVGQELREYEKNQVRLTKQSQTRVEEKLELYRKLGKKRQQICEALKKQSQPANDKKEQAGQPKARGFNVVRQLKESCGKRTEQTDRRVPLPLATSVREAKDIDALVKDEQKFGLLVETLKKEAPEVETNDQAKKEDSLVTLVVDYQELFQKFIDVSRDLLNNTTQAEALERAKNAIPTPFGNFQIAPKLALLGLAYATLLTYLSFLGSIRKIRSLATSYDQSSERKKPVQIPAPFWSPSAVPRRRSLSKTAGWPVATAIPSVTLHLIWLGLATWLTFECVFRWHATNSLAFDYRAFWGFLLIAVLAVSILGAVWQFTPARIKLFFERKKAIVRTSRWVKRFRAASKSGQKQPLTSRRDFLGLAGLAAVAVGGVTVFNYLALGVSKLRRASTGVTLPRLSLSQFVGKPEPDSWIQNERANKKKNKIIHYQPICKAHQPSRYVRVSSIIESRAQPTNAQLVNADKQLVHAHFQARIFEELGIEAHQRLLAQRVQRDPATRLNLAEYEKNQGQLAIIYFSKALALSPLSMHLYDGARRVYGTLGLYEQIKPLLEQGLNKVQSEIKLVDASSLSRKARKLEILRRDEKGFKSRISTTEQRRKKAEEWKLKQQKPSEAKPGDGSPQAQPINQ